MISWIRVYYHHYQQPLHMILTILSYVATSFLFPLFYRPCLLITSAYIPGSCYIRTEVKVVTYFSFSQRSNPNMVAAKVYIVYYSLYGHVDSMAREVHRGAATVEGVEATLWQVPETLSDQILQKMKAPDKPDDVRVIKPEQLAEADGFIFGFPSRFGMMPSQLKAFFDATPELWASQALAGKPAGIFWSTGFYGGGQELSALTAITQLAHHGMLFVPLGYTFGNGMFEMDEVKGGSAYGAGTFAADGNRQPTELELQQAFYQGKYIAGITKKLKR